METPDSIYIFTDEDERWYDVKEWEERTPPPANVEYIRKDALLEWLQQGFDWIKNPVISVQQIIDKLNSM